MRIFLVEDDQALAMGISYSLKQEGYEVIHCDTYRKAKLEIDSITEKSDMIGIFDVMLPDGDGFSLLEYLRGIGNDMPVVFLTAMSDEVNVVQGLELGADDYISKPFRVRELVSRIKAVSRRYYMSGRGDMESGKDKLLRYRDIEVDITAAKVYKHTSDTERRILELTPNEYRLLIYFMNNQGVALSRNNILEKIFDGFGNYVDDNTLSVYMKRLREKLGDNDKDTPYIRTIRGIGYMMEKQDAVE